MNYFLFKLRFETAVHFGPSDAALSLAASEEHVRADTLFFRPVSDGAVSLWARGGGGAVRAGAGGSCSSATPCPGGGIPCSFQSQ